MADNDNVRTMRFSCPHCGEPWARTREAEADIHGGSVHHCECCDHEVIFEVYTPAEYAARCEAQYGHSAEVRRG